MKQTIVALISCIALFFLTCFLLDVISKEHWSWFPIYMTGAMGTVCLLFFAVVFGVPAFMKVLNRD
jgi:hypothetical protein